MSNNIARTFSKEIINGADSSNTNYIKGDEWVAMTGPTNNPQDIRGLVWGKDRYVCGTNGDGKIYYSLDGNDWEEGHTDGSGTWRAFAYSPDLDRWVAISDNTNAKQIYSDDNAESWTAADTTENVVGINCIWGNGYYVCTIGSDDTNLLIYSTNGLDWTLVTIGTNRQSRGIVYAPSLDQWLICTGYDATTSVVLKPSVQGDPTGTWTTTGFSTSADCLNMAWSEKLGLFAMTISTAATDRGIWSSPDGASWTQRVTNVNNCVGIVWDDNIEAFLVAVSTTTNAYISYDGITWNLMTLPASSNWYRLAFSPTLRNTITMPSSAAVGARLDNIKGNSVEKTSEGALMRVENLEVTGILTATGISSYVVGISSYVVTLTSSQSIGDDSTTTITFSSSDEVSNGSNPPTFSGGTVTINEDGVYSVNGFISFNGTAGGVRRISLLLDDYSNPLRETADQISAQNRLEINDQYNFFSADTVVMQAYQNSGGNLDVLEASLSVTRIA